jgi:hypothetical protein
MLNKMVYCDHYLMKKEGGEVPDGEQMSCKKRIIRMTMIIKSHDRMVVATADIVVPLITIYHLHCVIVRDPLSTRGKKRQKIDARFKFHTMSKMNVHHSAC